MEAKHIGFLLLNGAIFLIILPFDQWDMLNGNRERWNIQHLRQQRIKGVCDKEVFSNQNKSFEDLNTSELRHLIVDDSHGLIFCYIPKVACSSWKRVLVVLHKNEPYGDPKAIPAAAVHSMKLPLLSELPRAEINVKLKHYTKILFVRDPFIRLISTFRSKFMTINEPYYKLYGNYILRKYGNQPNAPETMRQALEAGMLPSFHNFIQYLLDPQTEKYLPFDPHWRQMNRLCHPCFIKYDFIGHHENFQEDTELLLSNLNLQNEIKFPPSYENMTTTDYLVDWFKAMPLEDRKKVYKLYEKDFKLFGYRKPTEVLDD